MLVIQQSTAVRVPYSEHQKQVRCRESKVFVGCTKMCRAVSCVVGYGCGLWACHSAPIESSRYRGCHYAKILITALPVGGDRSMVADILLSMTCSEYSRLKNIPMLTIISLILRCDRLHIHNSKPIDNKRTICQRYASLPCVKTLVATPLHPIA